jgi:hypothetical protein
VVLLPVQKELLPVMDTAGKGVTLTVILLEYLTVQEASLSFARNWVFSVRLEKVFEVGLVLHPVSLVVEHPEVHRCQVTGPEFPLMVKLPPAPEHTLDGPLIAPGVVL